MRLILMLWKYRRLAKALLSPVVAYLEARKDGVVTQEELEEIKAQVLKAVEEAFRVIPKNA